MAHEPRSGSRPNTMLIKVKNEDIRPGDKMLGPAPAGFPADRPLARHLPREEAEMTTSQYRETSDVLAQPTHIRRTSLAGRKDISIADNEMTQYQGRNQIEKYERSESEEEEYSDGSLRSSRRPRRRLPRYHDSYDMYDSEDFPLSHDGRPERPRQHRHHGKPRGKYDSSSDSFSDFGDSSNDEKKLKKAKLKKWCTIGLAGVATIHAVHGAHYAMHKHKERKEELEHGDISLQQADRLKTRSRWRNAADIGIAAIWIKGAYDEIKESREAHIEYKEAADKHKERHYRHKERARDDRALYEDYRPSRAQPTF